MQTGVSVTNGSITGTLKYLSGDNAITQVWGPGNFLCLKFPDADISARIVKVGLDPTAGTGLVELDSDKNGIFKVTDKDTQRLVVLQKAGKDTQIQVFDLSGLTCNAE